jgi:magnesium-transporting ATPase (P-type)
MRSGVVKQQQMRTHPKPCAGMLCAASAACVLHISAAVCTLFVRVQVENVKNNLLLQLEILGRWLAVLVAVIALTAFLLAMFHAGNNFKTAFESAVAVAVSIIPEGLPAMVCSLLL